MAQRTDTKSLDVAQNEALRRLAKKVIDEKFEGKVSVAARAKPHPISHSLLFEFIQGGRGAGIKTLRWLSARTGQSVGELLGEKRRVSYDVNPNIPSTAIGHHRDWSRVRSETLERFGRFVDEAVLDEVGGMSLSRTPEHLSAEFVKGLHDALVTARGER